MNIANDDCGIAAMAGQNVNIEQQKTKSMGQQMLHSLNATIEKCAPKEAFEDGKLQTHLITAQIFHGGKKIYSFKGVPFVQINPAVIENRSEDGSYTIVVKVNYKALK